MFNLICVGFILLVGAILALIPGAEDIHIAGYTVLGFGGLWFLISSAVAFKSYSEQQNRFEKLRALLKKIPIYEEKSEKLMQEFKSHLGTVYPEIEKQIFKGISESSDKLKIVLANYPEIKSSEVLLELSNKLKGVVDELYKLKKSIEDSCAEIRYYAVGKWEIVKPSVPEDIRDVVYSPLPKKKEETS